MKFQVHSISNAPSESKPLLEAAQKKFGFVPNMLGVMAEAPALLKAYLTIADIFDSSTLSATEKQIVALTVSAVNGCEYCVSAHTGIAGMLQVPSDVVEAIREDKPIADKKLQSFRLLVAEIVGERGYPSETTLKNFLSHGYNEKNYLEILVGVGMKTLSNFTNHAALTPVDDAFKKVEWKKSL